tara:strand:- start:305 stop:790 length:486 start_codon:yes stop_codon:yes gene_type:complete
MPLSKIKTNSLATGAITSAIMPTGTVIQVVQGSTTTASSHGSTSTLSDTNLSASITPSSASNKILVTIQQHCYCLRYGGTIVIVRGSTNISAVTDTYQNYINPGTTASFRWYHTQSQLDSPNTTSAITYKTQAKSYDASNPLECQRSARWTSFITLMEIVG